MKAEERAREVMIHLASPWGDPEERERDEKAIAQAIREAVEAEREACAKLAEMNGRRERGTIAEAIRARCS